MVPVNMQIFNLLAFIILDRTLLYHNIDHQPARYYKKYNMLQPVKLLGSLD